MPKMCVINSRSIAPTPPHHLFQFCTAHPLRLHWRQVFFFARDDVGLVSACRLRTPASVAFSSGTVFDVLGLANVATAPRKRGQGEGEKLMRAVVEHMRTVEAARGTASRPLIGFCLHSNAGFYAKCGFTVVEGAAQLFQYTAAGALREADDDVFSTSDAAELLRAIRADGDRVAISRRHW